MTSARLKFRTNEVALNLFDDLIEVIGIRATIELCWARGGETVYIPTEITKAAHWLPRAVGAEAAAKIAYTYGRQKLTLPLGPTGQAAQLRRRLDELITAGASVNQITGELRIGRSTVYRHKRGRDDADQLKLF